mmetsp:Transcript_68472/g.178296  ORF Transcript_68472/g.178296 Transcript_68472/m.178296 type:complete len:282 (-) Transcript_68472:1423-2268(-)
MCSAKTSSLQPSAADARQRGPTARVGGSAALAGQQSPLAAAGHLGALQPRLRRDPRASLEERFGVMRVQVVRGQGALGGILGLARVRGALVFQVDREADLVTRLGLQRASGRVSRHAGDPRDPLDVGLELVDGGVAELIPLEVESHEVGAHVQQVDQEPGARLVQGIVLQMDLLRQVLLAVIHDDLLQLLQLLVGVLQAIQVELVVGLSIPLDALDVLPDLELVRRDLQERPHLPCLAELHLLVERHVLLAQGCQHAVGALEVLQVEVRLRLRGVQHLQDV